MKKEKLNIIYQDKFLIVINKPENLLTMSTDNEKEKTLFHQVLTFEKQKHKSNKVFIVHRLDRDTSGLVIFAKDEKTKKQLQDNWDKVVLKREYIAIVEGRLETKTGKVESYLKETSTLKVYSTKNAKEGKLAITKYKVIKENKNYSLLSVELLTGRKNQIRVHMSDIGHPIIGDKKYGAKTSPIKRLGLHANYLKIIHPVTKKEIIFESPMPKRFNDLSWREK